ncbi:hypothetical protein PPERSA_12090 [Pseudocohnilembus persalinus]|uniref:Uncharacterized protein n=1 Tax=Pseudocohnilembus persalinus TaxID=266149 RepID=A0A0V0R8Z1_PSEPJ|nr:hypothetical protein PPERSA_12090 [Pseudocohnilembus persalinus]|eukprot:KRX10966.1 hypothetical protein PPERSA_12090 [Pseudocohnilembus persalinus]
MEIKGSNLQNPDHFILLKDRKMVVLNLNYKGMQGQLFYEIWDLQKQSIIKQGKYDITGVNFISQFHKYKEDLVCVLCSRDGAREIVIYDFYENKKENFCQTLPYKDYQVKSLSQIQQLIPVPTQEKMILIEKVFLENDVYDEDTPQYYMFMHIKIIDKNFNSQLSNSFAEFSVRRDYSQEQEEIVVLKGNEQCLIIADQTNGEVMLWDFIKYPHQPVYLSFDCTDYKFKYVYFECTISNSCKYSNENEENDKQIYQQFIQQIQVNNENSKENVKQILSNNKEYNSEDFNNNNDIQEQFSNSSDNFEQELNNNSESHKNQKNRFFHVKTPSYIAESKNVTPYQQNQKNNEKLKDISQSQPIQQIKQSLNFRQEQIADYKKGKNETQKQSDLNDKLIQSSYQNSNNNKQLDQYERIQQQNYQKLINNYKQMSIKEEQKKNSHNNIMDSPLIQKIKQRDQNSGQF